MTKTGWWQVNFNITLDGNEVLVSDLDECSQEHILNCIKDGYRQGEIIQETDEES